MTVPTSIPETPMAHTDHKSIQESKDSSTSPRSMEVRHDIIYKVMDIQDEEEIQSLKQWMKYRDFEAFTEMYNAFSYMLDNIHDHSEYKLDGLRVALKFCTMNKIGLFSKWMFVSMTENNLKLYAEDLLS